MSQTAAIILHVDERPPVRYCLVVSRGYVRLARQGNLPSRRVVGRRFVRRDHEWMGTEPEPVDPDLLDEIRAELQLELDESSWINPEPLDSDIQAAIDEALDPRRGDAGLSARSRLNMRRMFVSLPWELLGAQPAQSSFLASSKAPRPSSIRMNIRPCSSPSMLVKPKRL